VPPATERSILLAPAAVAKTAAYAAAEPEQRWMLRQPRDVLSREDPPPLQSIWMLRQTDKVRESFVREGARGPVGSRAPCARRAPRPTRNGSPSSRS
jgi:hypothetical protein